MKKFNNRNIDKKVFRTILGAKVINART